MDIKYLDINDKNMSNGLRKPGSHILSEEEISLVKRAIEDIKADPSKFR